MKPRKFKLTAEMTDGTIREETTHAYDAAGAAIYLLEKHAALMQPGQVKTLLIEED